MSRTIRRTKSIKPYSRFEADYTHKPLDKWLDVAPSRSARTDGMPIRKLEGRAFDEAYWRFHTDNGRRDFGFEECFEKPQERSVGEVRAHYKRELAKWLKDANHEVILQKPKMFWEYY